MLSNRHLVRLGKLAYPKIGVDTKVVWVGAPEVWVPLLNDLDAGRPVCYSTFMLNPFFYRGVRKSLVMVAEYSMGTLYVYSVYLMRRKDTSILYEERHSDHDRNRR